MTQVADALYAFALGSPNKVTKISKIMDAAGPIIEKLQPLHHDCEGSLISFSVTKLGDFNIALTGGLDSDALDK